MRDPKKKLQAGLTKRARITSNRTMAMFDLPPPQFCIRAAPIVLMLSACAPSGTAEQAPIVPTQQAQSAVHPVSGLEIIDVAVASGEKTHVFATEVARTPQEQAKGLMFRTELGDFEGMLFPSDTAQVKSFWMKNTPLSLDIIFIGADGRIINIAANTTPYSLESSLSEGPAIAVLELRAGRSAALGIKPGDMVSWPQ
jgi:uncharacterized membrane protein (UPF0127 family)